jgi:hypothetical protein
MKNLIIITLFICTLFSCTKDYFEQYPQKWELIEMSGNIQNSVTIGANMAWQEFYLLDANGTFIKHREQDGLVMEVSGSFSFEENSDGKYLKLKYKTDNKLIGSCSKQEEWLGFDSNRLRSTWWACDGPGLLYKRIE